MTAENKDRAREALERYSVPEPNSGCVLWTGAYNFGGYGRVWIEGKRRASHRVAYELAVGPIPDGLTIDHLCRTPACVNPMHLEAVTMRENVMRGNTLPAMEAKRTVCLKGHPYDRIEVDGSRTCKTCDRDGARRRYNPEKRRASYDPEARRARWQSGRG